VGGKTKRTIVRPVGQRGNDKSLQWQDSKQPANRGVDLQDGGARQHRKTTKTGTAAGETKARWGAYLTGIKTGLGRDVGKKKSSRLCWGA